MATLALTSDLNATCAAVLKRQEELRAKWRSMQALGDSLAYQASVSIIESNCLDLGDDVWDIGSVAQYADAAVLETVQREVRDAVTYLEWRGLLLRDVCQPEHVSILDESEAAR